MNSQYELCLEHHQKLGSFCPKCSQFLCIECECPHYPDVKPIPIWYINKYLRSYNLQQVAPNQDQINAAKKALIDEFNMQEQTLKIAFTKSIKFLDSYAAKKADLDALKKSLVELGVNDKGIAMISSLADKRKNEDINSITGTRSFLKYAEKGRNIIQEMQLITAKLTDLLEFLKAPLIPTNTLLHYLNGNSLAIIDTLSKSKKMITLNLSINGNADSIAYMGRIFIMGGNGEPYSNEYFEKKREESKSSKILIRR